MAAEQQKHNELFYACKYTPIELLAGFGAAPRIAEADVASFAYADALTHPNFCGYGKGLIERMMDGRYAPSKFALHAQTPFGHNGKRVN